MVKKIDDIEILGPNDTVPSGIKCINPSPIDVFKEIVRNPGSFGDIDGVSTLYAILDGDLEVPETPNVPFDHAGNTIFPPNSPIPMRGFKPA